MSDDAKKIKSILGEFISKNALTDGIDSARIQESWRELMGENIDAYTKKISLQQDILVVKLTSSVLRQELSYGKDKIIEMINESLGKDKVRDIRFYLVDLPCGKVECALNICVVIAVRSVNRVSSYRLRKQFSDGSFCRFLGVC